MMDKYLLHRRTRYFSIKIFLSYKWEDLDYVNGIDGLLNNPNNEYSYITDREREDLRHKGEKDVKNYLKKKIKNNNLILCLIGQNTHNATGVKYEIEVAKSLKKKIIAVRIPETTGGMPYTMRKWKVPLIEWNSKAINNAIRTPLIFKNYICKSGNLDV